MTRGHATHNDRYRTKLFEMGVGPGFITLSERPGKESRVAQAIRVESVAHSKSGLAYEKLQDK